MERKQSRMLQIVGIVLIAWGVVRGSFFIYALITDFYEITPYGIIMIQGFHMVADVYLLELVSWTRIMTEYLLVLFWIVVDLIVGILGVANWKRAEFSDRCLLWVAVAIIINIAVMFSLDALVGLGSLGLHILYMISVFRLKKRVQCLL